MPEADPWPREAARLEGASERAGAYLEGLGKGVPLNREEWLRLMKAAVDGYRDATAKELDARELVPLGDGDVPF